MKRLLAVALLAGSCAGAQSLAVYDDFSTPALDPVRWTSITEDGSQLATASASEGTLTVNSAPYRTGAATHARIGAKGAVQVTAVGWQNRNQILQLYCGPQGFVHWLEFGLEDTEADGTPIVHVWCPGSSGYAGRSPVPGPISPANPTTLRIEKDGSAYRFFANDIQVFTLNSDTLDNDARVVLYGWSNSISRWRSLQMSGPSVTLTSPVPGQAVAGGAEIAGSVGPEAVSWRLDVGAGASPRVWTQIATGEGQGPVSASWNPDASQPGGAYVIRLSATDAAGNTRSYWAPVTLARPVITQPFAGQVVGSAVTMLVQPNGPFTHAQYLDNGVQFAEGGLPFSARRIFPAGSDGPHTLSAVLSTADGFSVATRGVDITVDRGLYGGNARVADDGRAFVFPSGQVGVAIGENDGYDWPGPQALFRNGDIAAADSYVAMLKASGVNVMRIMTEYAQLTDQFMESPLGTYRPQWVSFWEAFLPICEKYGVTILATPWDTFWMNQPWSQNPYNAANGGPCQTQHDFIVSPAARAAQKARFKYLIDHFGNSTAIFAWDLLNEYDIWWDATPEERRDWVNEMAQYVQDYEYAKWGHRHMVTVSTAWNQPTGITGDVALRHPRFEFANTHLYYGGTVNNPQNIIDPALSVNQGVRANLAAIEDGRPYLDSESGPIDLPAPWLTNQPAFDTQYFHHMSWAHLASGGNGGGMRWPYLAPHYLTPAMHQHQKAMAAVCAEMDWAHFHVQNADARASASPSGLITMASSDGRQALVWVTEDVRATAAHTITGATVTLTGMDSAHYQVKCWNTNTGAVITKADLTAVNGTLTIPLPSLSLDMAVTVRPPLRGDASQDGKLTVLDASYALRDSAGLRKPSAAEYAGADYNTDGVIDMVDVAGIMTAVRRG